MLIDPLPRVVDPPPTDDDVEDEPEVVSEIEEPNWGNITQESYFIILGI